MRASDRTCNRKCARPRLVGPCANYTAINGNRKRICTAWLDIKSSDGDCLKAITNRNRRYFGEANGRGIGVDRESLGEPLKPPSVHGAHTVGVAQPRLESGRREDLCKRQCINIEVRGGNNVVECSARRAFEIERRIHRASAERRERHRGGDRSKASAGRSRSNGRRLGIERREGEERGDPCRVQVVQGCRLRVIERVGAKGSVGDGKGCRELRNVIGDCCFEERIGHVCIFAQPENNVSRPGAASEREKPDVERRVGVANPGRGNGDRGLGVVIARHQYPENHRAIAAATTHGADGVVVLSGAAATTSAEAISAV